MVLLPCLTGCLHSHMPATFPQGWAPQLGFPFQMCCGKSTDRHHHCPPTPHQQIAPWKSSPQPAAQRGKGSRRRLGTALRRRHSHIPSQNICALAKTVVLRAPLQQVRDFLGEESMARIQPHSYICASLYAQQHACKLKGLKLIMCKTVCVWEDLDCHDGKN